MSTPARPARPDRRPGDPLNGRVLPTPAHRMLGGQLISTLHEVAQAQRKVDSLTGELAAAQQALADLTAAQADLEDLLDTLDARQA